MLVNPSDQLRSARKDAPTAYLVADGKMADRGTVDPTNSLVPIDVEMGTCMMTSRISRQSRLCSFSSSVSHESEQHATIIDR
jgi:hypothetical protein